MKVVYLKGVATQANSHVLKLIKKRGDPAIQSDVDKYFFHYHPVNVDLSAAFQQLQLHVPWSLSQVFHIAMKSEVAKYKLGQINYCPLAICFAVRVQIEKLMYDQIGTPAHQNDFINQHGTNNKLDFCSSIGLDVSDMMSLLGIIYNDRLHWRDGLDIVTPLAIKLENKTIKKLISDLFP